MVRIAKRNSARCPTHPGALLREDVIPATGRTKAEIAQSSASPVNICSRAYTEGIALCCVVVTCYHPGSCR
jgi:hypothetical protein